MAEDTATRWGHGEGVRGPEEEALWKPPFTFGPALFYFNHQKAVREEVVSARANKLLH
jgi:hypothetical protein